MSAATPPEGRVFPILRAMRSLVEIHDVALALLRAAEQRYTRNRQAVVTAPADASA